MQKQGVYGLIGGSAATVYDHSVLLATFFQRDGRAAVESVHCYHSHTDEWQKIVVLERYVTLTHAEHSSDGFSNALLSSFLHTIYNSDQSVALDSIDPNEICVDLLEAWMPYLVNVGTTLHAIGNSFSSTHWIWDDTSRKFKVLHNNAPFGKTFGHSLVHVPSKRLIVMAGGFSGLSRNARNNFWMYNLDSKEWKRMQGVSLERDQRYACACLSVDERYIVLAGGTNERLEPVDLIHVLDISDPEHCKLRRSSIRLPMGGQHHVLRTGGGVRDEMLVTCWARELFAGTRFQHLSLPPLYILRLIVKQYAEEEMIHFMRRSRGNEHFCIALKHVLR